jgi:hypothetical protein
MATAYIASRPQPAEMNFMRRFSFRTMVLVIAAVAVVYAVFAPFIPRRPQLRIPRGTPPKLAAAIRDAWADPSLSGRISRPGWADLEYSEPMERIVAFKQQAVPVLLANLDNREFRPKVIQMLGDLKATTAVPALVDQLEKLAGPEFDDGERGDLDRVAQSMLLAKLAEITNHPDGYDFYRRGFDERVRRAAVEEYRQWYRDHQASNKK